VFQLKDPLPSPDSLMAMHSAQTACYNFLECCAILADYLQRQRERERDLTKIETPHISNFICGGKLCRSPPMKYLVPEKRKKKDTRA
jgi:hypothetical protein